MTFNRTYRYMLKGAPGVRAGRLPMTKQGETSGRTRDEGGKYRGSLAQGDVEMVERIIECAQCHKDIGSEWILGPVCGKCCRANHRRVAGGR